MNKKIPESYYEAIAKMICGDGVSALDLFTFKDTQTSTSTRQGVYQTPGVDDIAAEQAKVQPVNWRVTYMYNCPSCRKLIEFGAAHDCLSRPNGKIIDLEFMPDEPPLLPSGE